MAIVYDKLLALKIPDVERSYTQRDPIFYALSLGFGQDPMNAEQLPFVLRERPESAADLSGRRRAARHVGARARHRHRLGEDRAWRARPRHAQAAAAGRHGHEPDARARRRSTRAPARARWSIRSARCTTRRAASCSRPSRRRASAAATAASAARSAPTPAPHAIPDRAPDAVCDLPTRPEMALIYRWNADMNPLHSDPAIAKAAGYPRPILHGLATFGVAGHAILKTMCGYDPARFKSIAGRFSVAGLSGRDDPHRDVARRAGREFPRAPGRARCDRAEQRTRRDRQLMSAHPRQRRDRRHPRRPCARCARTSPANTGASSIASAPIRPSSSMR